MAARLECHGHGEGKESDHVVMPSSCAACARSLLLGCCGSGCASVAFHRRVDLDGPPFDAARSGSAHPVNPAWARSIAAFWLRRPVWQTMTSARSRGNSSIAARELAERNEASIPRSCTVRIPTARERRRAPEVRATRRRASARDRPERAAGSKLETRRRGGVRQRVDDGLEQDALREARPARPSARVARASPGARRRRRRRVLPAQADR